MRGKESLEWISVSKSDTTCKWPLGIRYDTKISQVIIQGDHNLCIVMEILNSSGPSDNDLKLNKAIVHNYWFRWWAAVH